MSSQSGSSTSANVLWYRQPAEEWLQALPVGNGRLGAMVHGDPHAERVQLNEETLWAGDGADHANPEAADHLQPVRDHLAAGRHAEAEAVADEHLLGDPRRLRPYQTLGDLRLHFPDRDGVEDYRRELDLATGVAATRYDAGETTYRHEVFASAPADVLVVRVEADGPGTVEATVSFDRGRDARSGTVGDDGLVLRGRVVDLPEPEKGDGGWGPRFEGRVRALREGGTVTAEGDALHVEDADALTLLVAAATDVGVDDPTAACEAAVDAAAGTDYGTLREAHVADHRELFKRVAVDLGPPVDAPTDERLAAVREGGTDPDLAALYFQFGRYLLIASSRPGTLPATLQGIWNEDFEPAWNSGYTTNVNLEMNYWPAEVANLPECASALVEFVDSLRESGRRTAEAHYGCSGWTLHHNTDLWRHTAPVDGVWGVWPMGAAWLCRRLWAHYAFSADTDALERVYPVMREAAEFLVEFLVEDDRGQLVTNPSHSPENQFVAPDGHEARLGIGATMDLELVHDLFTNCAEAARALDRDPAFREELEAALDCLPSLQVGEHGQLQEWLADYEEVDPGHRHMSHLYCFHPGDQVTLRDDPDLAAAVRTAVERRLDHGGGSTGWSRAWLVNLLARFEDGETARDHLQVLLREYTTDALLDLHPPEIFQIDGNLGGAAGVAEMLLQSHAGEVSLLPALPDAWSAGAVSGLRARGGFGVDVEWADGTLSRATVQSAAGRRCRVRVHGVAARDVAVTTGDGDAVAVDRPASDVLAFATTAGGTYHLVA